MFKNKYLKELKDVQEKMRINSANIKALKYPIPDSAKIQLDLFKLLRHSACGIQPDIEALSRDLECETFDYFRQLGQYLIDICGYRDAARKCNTELLELQIKERNLKAKLGID